MARLPALFAVVTAAIAWVIWYYTNTVCTAELAAIIGCNPAMIARYIDIDIFGRMLTYSAITAAAGGVWNYSMFTKMRAVIAAETKRANEAEQRLAEYRQQIDEERRQEHQACMAALSELTAELAHLRQQRNGHGQNGQ